MVDLLRFLVELTTDANRRERFRRDPAAVLAAEVVDADQLTGEDVEAAAAWARERLDDERADLLRVASPVRPLGEETPLGAALRILEELCTALEGPSAEVVTLDPVPPEEPPASPTAAGGGAPVPDQPPSLRGRRLWAVDGEGAGTRATDPEHQAAGERLVAVPVPEGGFALEPLDEVTLPRGLPEAGVEPGARAVVIAVHTGREDPYEIEVSDVDGGRRFLGTVRPDQVEPVLG